MANEPKRQEVVAQKNKVVGDKDAQARKVEPEVNTDAVKAQVAPPREADPKQVPVHETKVATDEVVTDPNSPEAVQVPDAGRGSLDLPIHRLGAGTPEDQFASGDADEPETTPAKDEKPSS